MPPAVEVYFPRGKAKSDSTKDKNVDKKVYHKDEKNIDHNRFVNIFSNDHDGSKEKKLLKQKSKELEKKKKADNDCVPSLSYKDLREGMVTSAVVTSVSDYKVKLALPFHLTASLSIANISSVLTQLLKKAAADDSDSEDEEIDDVPSMKQLFKIGQYLVVAVCSITKDETDVYEVSVSLDPRLVMAGRVPDSGDLVVGMVKSKEDHGYIMDVGNQGFTAFLSSKSAESMTTVCIGMVFLCSVTRKIGNALTLQCNPGKYFNKNNEKPNMNNLLPLNTIKVKLIKKLSNGFKVEYGKQRVGFIHKDLLADNKSQLDDYKVNSYLEARIVLELPSINSIMFSLRTVWPFTTTFKNVNVGDLIKEAQVIDVMNSQLDLSLGPGALGVVPVLYAQANISATTKLPDAFEVGDKLRARVVYQDYFTGQAVCSLLKYRTENPEMEGFKIGQIVVATVKDINDKGVNFFCGDVTGYAYNCFLFDSDSGNPQEAFPVGKEVDCKIIGLDSERNHLRLTAKPSLVKKEYEGILDLNTVEIGDCTLGVVGRIYPTGALIFLQNDLSGWISSSSFYKTGKKPYQMFYLGQTVEVQVTKVNVDDEKINLRLVDDVQVRRSKNNKLDVFEVGRYCRAKVVEVTKSGLEVETEFNGSMVKCTVPKYHLTDNLVLADTLLQNYKENDEIRSVYFSYDSTPVLTMKPSIMFTNQSLPNYHQLVKDDLVPAVVQSIEDEMIILDTTSRDCLSCVVPLECISKPEDEDLSDMLEVGQSIFVKVLRKNETLQQIIGSINLKNGSQDGISRFTPCHYIKGILDNLAFLRERSSGRLSTIEIGDIVEAKVQAVTDMGAVLQVIGKEGYEGVKALAPASNFGQAKPEPEATIKVLVLFIDYQAGVIEVCCDQSIVEACTDVTRLWFRKESEYTGEIVLTRTQLKLHILLVTEPKKFKGNLVFIPDLEEDLVESSETEGTLIRRKVEVTSKVVTRKGEIICVNEEFEDRKRAGEEGVDEEDGRPTKKIKKEKLPDLQITDDLWVLFHGKNAEQAKIKKEEDIKEEVMEAENEIADDSIAVFEEQKMDVAVDNVPTTTLADPGWDFNATGITLPAWGKVSIWGDDVSEEEDNTTTDDKKSKKYISKKEAKRLKREEEKAAEQQENKIIQGDMLPPQTEEEFERLVASSPDSSLVWIQFMAHYLQSCQYDMARALAKKAVNRINFREESEILNVYLAWLNLENAFGTPESLDTVLKEAVQRNDEYKVLSQMTDVFDKSSKFTEAEKVFKTLAKKYGKIKDMWVRYGLFYFKNSRKEEGRAVFTRGLQNLEIREAADLSTKFAQLEFKYGDTERGKTMYEKLVSTYPKRVDIWKSYAEQLTRIGDVGVTRSLYIRISTLGLQAKKMKALFAKWLEFETTYGTEEQQGVVRAAALQYLNKQVADDPVPA